MNVSFWKAADCPSTIIGSLFKNRLTKWHQQSKPSLFCLAWRRNSPKILSYPRHWQNHHLNRCSSHYATLYEDRWCSFTVPPGFCDLAFSRIFKDCLELRVAIVFLLPQYFSKIRIYVLFLIWFYRSQNINFEKLPQYRNISPTDAVMEYPDICDCLNTKSPQFQPQFLKM